ncbi:hypothetical protein [Ruminiclostridium papyrosolvens]|uniref:Uncharacterized protein n=1 Tax=Ruminiclostridium papyrosolvens C7 TaxID=1330534 RepID=U4R441_9FIRM|nr:hypothetical protein [Ruminiclostridium papyrosolvens]EPR12495.1 hypothetical protein L323_08050 [Ruminiclostridium papyrosolvens C7]
MNVGEMQDLIQILSIEQADNSYSWETATEIWSKAERQTTRNIYSNFGQSAKSVKFTIREYEYDLSLHNAIRWNDLHCILTDIIHTENREFIIVTAALVNPQVCTIKRDSEPGYDSLNRPVYSEPISIIFPGILAEKFNRNIQEQPMTTIETSLILIIPKAITLQEGELVTIDNTDYEVQLAHTLDEFKNEYEIISRRNV